MNKTTLELIEKLKADVIESNAMSNEIHRVLTISRTGDNWAGKEVPKVTLTGKWLADMGITPGMKVNVSIVGNSMIITPQGE